MGSHMLFFLLGVYCIEGGRARNAPQKMGSRSPHRQMFGSQIVRLIKVKYKPSNVYLFFYYMRVSVLAIITFLISLATKI